MLSGRRVAGILALSVVPAVLAAQERAAPRREPTGVEPTLTEETLPNEVGEYDVRLTADYRRRGSDIVAAGRTQLFFGLIGRLGGEVEAAVDYARVGGAGDRAGAVGLGLKWLVAGGETSAVVLGLEAEAPVGRFAAGIGANSYEVTPFVAVRRDLGPVIVQGNVGPAIERELGSGETRTAAAYSWAALVPVTEGRFLVAELVGRTGSGGEPARAVVAPGVKLELGAELWFGAAVPIGLSDAAEQWGIVVQVQRGF